MSFCIHHHLGPGLPDKLAFAEGLEPLESTAAAGEFPDGRVFVSDLKGVIVAHVALWWRESPVFEGRHLGAIGGFGAVDADSASAVLEAAVGKLMDVGCRMAVGPMNGNTWRKHRWVVESEGRGPFLMEPRNQPGFPVWWESAGFTVLSRYSSSAMPLDGPDALPESVKGRLQGAGVTIRDLDPADFENELRRIHGVSVKSFAGNFLYTPLEEDDFIGAYRKIRERVEPEFVKISEKQGVPCGFVFGIRDWEAQARGEKPAVIVKTLAVDPAARCAGLGCWLVDELHQAARRRGFHESIHALQHESNTSLKITGRHQGRVFRRYALFSRAL